MASGKKKRDNMRTDFFEQVIKWPNLYVVVVLCCLLIFLRNELENHQVDNMVFWYDRVSLITDLPVIRIYRNWLQAQSELTYSLRALFSKDDKRIRKSLIEGNV